LFSKTAIADLGKVEEVVGKTFHDLRRAILEKQSMLQLTHYFFKWPQYLLYFLSFLLSKLIELNNNFIDHFMVEFDSYVILYDRIQGISQLMRYSCIYDPEELVVFHHHLVHNILRLVNYLDEGIFIPSENIICFLDHHVDHSVSVAFFKIYAFEDHVV
jgi:hypothetical protein